MAIPCFALDSSDLIFHLAFEDGTAVEFARGSATATNVPQQLQERLVPGLIGKGYRFAGKGSTLFYFTDDRGGNRACFESYGTKANLFGNAGTIVVWIKPLQNTHNMAHRLFLCNPGWQLMRSQYGQYGYAFGPSWKGSLVYDGWFARDAWQFFAMIWRKNEVWGCYNGACGGKVTDTGEMTTVPATFEVASEGLTWEAFQEKVFQDDAVMDEMQVFRRALSDAEIRSLFERGHVTTKHQTGNIVDNNVTVPERAYVPSVLAASVLSASIAADGKLEEWKNVPAHGGWIERRVGVLDRDPGLVYAANDNERLYLAFACPVEESLKNDPTHVLYPTGEFLANPVARDGAVYDDDYVEFVLKSTDGHEFRFALNAKGVLLDSRDGDKAWNGDFQFASRADFNDWTAELSIPLAQLGMTAGQTVGFNVVRSWKLISSSQNTLCANEQSQPALGTLKLGGPFGVPPSGGPGQIPPEGGTPNASVTSLGKPGDVNLDIRGTISGPAGEYTVKVHAKGYGQEFTEERKFPPGPFAIQHRLEKPGDLGVVVEVRDPAGAPILARSIPIVYSAPSTVQLVRFPGVGKLDVIVAPTDAKGARATVELRSADFQSAVPPISNRHDGAQASTSASGLETRDTADWKSALRSDIPAFDDPAKTVTFDTRALPVGMYDLNTKLFRGDAVVGEDHQPFEKKPLPEWVHSTNGIMATPPIPWTDVKVRGDTVQLLLKDIKFNKTLFPSEIISNGQSLFDAPPRIRVKQNGKERVITAGKFRFTGKTKRRATWEATGGDAELQVTVKGWIEFDGFTWMEVTFAGEKVEHVSLEIPLKKEAALYMSSVGKLDDKPRTTPHSFHWIVNETAGFGWFWEHQGGWVLNGEPMAYITPTNDTPHLTSPPSGEESKPPQASASDFLSPRSRGERTKVRGASGGSAQDDPRSGERGYSQVVISFPFIQKPTDLAKPRTVTFGWIPLPPKPVRKDWRTLSLYRGVDVCQGDYCFVTPNYPKPREKEETYRFWQERYNRPTWPIECWYAFGPSIWGGSPEFIEWCNEWRAQPSAPIQADPNSNGWGVICPNSTGTDLYFWMLDSFVRKYHQRGVWIDCMGVPTCNSELHGCGYVDDNGVRQTALCILASRRYYERLWNIHKNADPKLAWIKYHDWMITPWLISFADDNWIGEGLIGAINASPEKNYYRVMDFTSARLNFVPERWGMINGWLGELGTTVGNNDPEQRAALMGKMISPPKDGKHGEWVLPRWKDFEHAAGIGILHDMFSVEGIPWQWVQELERQMRWDDQVRFVGYWELAGKRHPSPYPLPQGERKFSSATTKQFPQGERFHDPMLANRAHEPLPTRKTWPWLSLRKSLEINEAVSRFMGSDKTGRTSETATHISSPPLAPKAFGVGGEDKGEGNRSNMASVLLHVEGAVPDKIECSVYYRPAGLPKPDVPELDPEARSIFWRGFTVSEPMRAFLRAAGENAKGWLVLAPMNNTDQDVTLTLRPNLARLDFKHLANGRALDIFRAYDFEYDPQPGWKANNADPETPHFKFKGREESFPVKDGAVTVTIPKRSFRMLLLESNAAEMR